MQNFIIFVPLNMKKTLILTVAVLLTGVSVAARHMPTRQNGPAQRKLSMHQTPAKEKTVLFGVRAGVVASQIIAPEEPYGHWRNRKQTLHWGYTVGVLAEFRIARKFSIQPELLVTLKGSTSKGEAFIDKTLNAYYTNDVAYERQSQNLTYLELPVRFVLKIPVDKNFLNISAAPYAAYGIHGVVRSHYTRDGVNIDDRVEDAALKANLFKGENRFYSRLDFGIAATLGFEFDFGLFVDAGYGASVISIAASRNPATGRRYRDLNSNISISAGYKF
jgi:hypothetical protein